MNDELLQLHDSLAYSYWVSFIMLCLFYLTFKLLGIRLRFHNINKPQFGRIFSDKSLIQITLFSNIPLGANVITLKIRSQIFHTHSLLFALRLPGAAIIVWDSSPFPPSHSPVGLPSNFNCFPTKYI